MGKQRTVHGPYGGDDLGRDATGPLRVTEMDRERTRPKSVADGVSFVDLGTATPTRKVTVGYRVRLNAALKPMEAATEQEPTIEERLAELYAEMDVIVAKYIDERAAACIGVPRGSIENSYLARAHGCRCEEYRVVRQLIKTAEELARKQQVDCALPEG